MTSEDILGFIAPPRHQCGNIDKYIRSANDTARSISLACKSDDLEEVKGHCSDADWDAGNIEEHFEKLRIALDEVRCWGQQWKELAKELIEEYEPDKLNQDNGRISDNAKTSPSKSGRHRHYATLRPVRC